MRTRIRNMVGVVGAAVLVTASCGSDDTTAANGSGEPADLTVTATEWQFDPDSSQIEAGEFSVELINEGTLEHEWAVMTLDGQIESEDDFESKDQVLLEVEAIPAGDTARGEFSIDVPGTYQVVCLIDAHFDSGMEGSLTVV